MITLKEYDSTMENLVNAAYTSGDFSPVSDFQYQHMQEYYDYYVSKAEMEIEKYACKILDYLITYSESGSVIQYVDSEEQADKLKDYLNEHEFYGDIMLDSPQIYHCERNNKWAVDCMFGGNYTPCWDGWFN